jgi:hypothetical protein
MTRGEYPTLTDLLSAFFTMKARRRLLSSLMTEQKPTTTQSSNTPGPTSTAVYLKSANLRSQMISAHLLMQDYYNYARSIGCVVTEDEIQCGDIQALMLMQYWRKRTIHEKDQSG